MFSIEFPVSVGGTSAVFNVVNHCTVVGTIIFIFPWYVCD